jgi:hypothetical protein
MECERKGAGGQGRQSLTRAHSYAYTLIPVYTQDDNSADFDYSCHHADKA